MVLLGVALHGLSPASIILVPASMSALVYARKLTEIEFQYAYFHCVLTWKGMDVGLTANRGLTEK